MDTEAFVKMLARIRRDPAYAPASSRFIAEYVQWRDDLGMLNKVIANVARLRTLQNLLYLHLMPPGPEGRQGATFERLAQISGAVDDVGARAVRTLLRLAQTAGLIATERNPADGRQRVYVPTEALFAQARAYTLLLVRPLDPIFPHLRVVERLEADPEFYRAVFMGYAGAYFDSDVGRRPLSPDGYRAVLRLEGAATIFCVVIDCFHNGRHIPAAREFSRRFLISQSQVRAVLKAAEAAGLIKTAPHGRLIDAEPLAQALGEAHLRFLTFVALKIFHTGDALAS